MDSSVGWELRRALGEAGVTQYWLAKRARLSPVTVSRIVNGIRHPTEAQVFGLCCGLLCTGGDYASYLDVVYANDDQLARVIGTMLASKGISVAHAAGRSHIGWMTVERFVRNESAVSRAKVLRIFAAVVFNKKCLILVNALLEAAGYYVIGEVDDDRQTA